MRWRLKGSPPCPGAAVPDQTGYGPERPQRCNHRLQSLSLDVHKRTIRYCVKDGSGTIHAEGAIAATRFDLDLWIKTLPPPWTAAMEATVFTGWIYDHLQPHARALKVAHR